MYAVPKPPTPEECCAAILGVAATLVNDHHAGRVERDSGAHASSPDEAFEALSYLVREGGLALDADDDASSLRS